MFRTRGAEIGVQKAINVPYFPLQTRAASIYTSLGTRTAHSKIQLQQPGINLQRAATMHILTQYVEYFTLKCEDLDLTQSTTLLNTHIHCFSTGKKSGQGVQLLFKFPPPHALLYFAHHVSMFFLLNAVFLGFEEIKTKIKTCFSCSVNTCYHSE